MRIYFTLLLITFSLLGSTQSYNQSMVVSRDDLILNNFPQDSTANAVIIYDYGNSFIDKETFKLRFQTEQKIKVLKKEGIKYGEVEVKLYKGKSSNETISKIKGATYNLVDGKIVKTKLKPEAIFEEDFEKYKLVKFVLPKVSVGSVITYSYETQSRFIVKFQPWYFQGEEPVLYSEYNTSIPGNYEYHIKLVGSIPLETNDRVIKKNCIVVGNGSSANCAVSKYIMKNIPAYKPEAFMTTSLNYLARIEYELSVVRGFDGSVDKIAKTWKSVDKELKTDNDFGRQLGKKSVAKKILPKDISSIKSNYDKAVAIHRFVSENYKWDGKYERYDVSVKDLLKEKSGNAFEINILLENLLTSQGFKVYPILVSTRKNGLATKIYPVLTDFNYLILRTEIDGENYFLDATDPFLSFGELPFRCLNQYGRLIDFEDGGYWKNIEVEDYSKRLHRVQLDALSDDILSGKIESTFSGYHALEEKRDYSENSASYKNKKAEKYSNIQINGLEIKDFKKDNYDFKESITFSMEPEIIGDKIYINPFVIKFFEENPFKLQERTYPIDFGYKDIYNYVLTISLADNYKIIEIPDSIKYSLPNKSGDFIFNVEKKEDKLNLYFKIKFDKAIYGPQYYKYLKQFMNKVVETQKNTVIVLEKL